MKANPEKCHLLVCVKNTSIILVSDKLKIDINGVKIESSLKQKVLGVIPDD